MNNSKKPFASYTGGTAERQQINNQSRVQQTRGQMPNSARQAYGQPTGAQRGQGYTQMPIRPMTPMQTPQRKSPAAQQKERWQMPQRPSDPRQRPADVNNLRQRPADPRQKPASLQQTAAGASSARRPAVPQGAQRAPAKNAPAVNNIRPVQRQGQAPAGAVRPQPQGARPVQGQSSRPAQTSSRQQAPVQRRPVDPRAAQNTRSAKNARSGQPAPQKRPVRQNEWIVPEGSPVYTAQGRMYEGQRRPPDTRGPGGAGSYPADRRPSGSRPVPKKKKKRINKERVLLHVKTFFLRLLTMLIVVGMLGLWWYRAEFYSAQDAPKGKVSFTLDAERTYEVKAATAYKGDVLYVDFTEIAEWFGMVSVGSVNAMRFICTEGVSETSSGKGGEEYAIFSSGSTSVFINGQTVSLEAPCRTVETHIWIPLSFVENYLSGIVCDRGAKGTDITFTPEKIGEEDSEEEIVITASFKVKAQNALAHQSYPDQESGN